MSDVVFLLVVVGFFVVAAGFVHVCDRIVGRDESGPAAERPPDVVAAAVGATGTEA